MGAANVGLTCFRESEIAHLSFFNQLRHRADSLLDRYCGINAVLVEQVDAVGPEPAKRGFSYFPNMLRPAVQSARRLHSYPKSEFRRNNHLVAEALQRSSQQLLIRIRAIDLGGIKERHTEIDSSMDCGYRLLVVRDSIGITHSHAAQAEG